MSGLINSAGSKSGVIGTTELDYEEGTFSAELRGQGGRATTPVIANDTSGLQADYIKIGKAVHINIHFYQTNLTGASGQIQITNLPFTCGASGGTLSIGYMQNITWGTDYVPVWVVSGTTISGYQVKADSNYGDWTPIYGTTRTFRLSGTYMID